MTDEYATDRRVALDLDRMLGKFGLHYSSVSSSTQTVVKQLIDRGDIPPVIVVTEEQTEGRGRLDRIWTAPPFSSVLMSVGLRPVNQQQTFTLNVGVIVAEALATCGVAVGLKWPNDIVVAQAGAVRKLGGILAEIHRDFVVVGIGLNIDMDDAELPTRDAISCRQLGATVSREALIAAIVDGLALAPSPSMMVRYRELCITLGAEIEITQIVGEPLCGVAVAIDDDGALVVRDSAGAQQRITVGDVRHVRPGVER